MSDGIRSRGRGKKKGFGKSGMSRGYVRPRDKGERECKRRSLERGE